MTIFFPDVSGHEAGISLKGALAVAIKITEGTTYVNPDWRRARSDAESRGAFAFGYHFLHPGNGAGQARAYHAQTTMPCAVDAEATDTGNPHISDVTDFVDELRKLGGRVHLVYLPHWFWQDIGEPDLGALRARNLYTWSSAYTSYTDSDSGTGWQPYGGNTPAVWQYTDRLKFNGFSVDFSAYRGRYAGKQDSVSVAAALADFKSIASDGHVVQNLNPVTGFKLVKRGFTGFNIAWNAMPGATGYTAHAKLPSGGKVARTVTTDKTSCRLGLLRPGRKYIITVRAHPSDATEATFTFTASTKG